MADVIAKLEEALAAAPDDATKAAIQALIDQLGGGASAKSVKSGDSGPPPPHP